MKHWKLEYREPAASWTEAMPLGNGKTAAFVYGSHKDRVSLNLSTLWSGNGSWKGNPAGKADWDSIRKAVYEENYTKAEKMIKSTVLGDWTECYLPAANLYMDLSGMPLEETGGYHRQLDLTRALYSEEYREGEQGYGKEAFVDFAHNVVAIRLYSLGTTRLNLILSMDSALSHQIAAEERADSLLLLGRAPSYAAPNYYDCKNPIRYDGEGMEFALRLRAETKEGSCERQGDTLVIEDAKEVLLFVSGNTSFCKEEITLLTDDSWKALVEEQLEAAGKTGYEAMKEANIDYYRSFFNRMELELGAQQEEERSTGERIRKFYKTEDDMDLVALMFHFGRYLLIASSVPGGECANLQGIWNEQLRAPWSSNYTVNINTEMNYWPAESCNLSELTEPLFGLMKRTAEKGRRAAGEMYGADGWVSHHNVDLWGHSTPVGYYGQDDNPCVYGMWNMSSGWMCRHLWEHYCYTLDEKFLEEEAYPLVEGAAAFYLDCLWEKDGVAFTVPSTSPENLFLDKKGKPHAVTLSSTMDVAILKELFGYFIRMSEILGKDKNVERCREALKKLPDYRIGKYGQLQEWYRDYEEADVNHRHVSHLYGLYPSNTITEKDRELRDACKVVLERRGEEGTGWGIAWRACLWARLGDGNRMLRLLKKQLRYTDCEVVAMKGGGTYGNLLCAHPPFQIDGNFGYTAAVAEAILQSHEEQVVLLPAVPDQWAEGCVKGIRARGGYTFDFIWKEKQVRELTVTADRPGTVTVRFNGREETLSFLKDQLSIKVTV